MHETVIQRMRGSFSPAQTNAEERDIMKLTSKPFAEALLPMTARIGLLIGVLILPSQAPATTIPGVTATASSQYPGREPIYAVNGVGLYRVSDMLFGAGDNSAVTPDQGHTFAPPDGLMWLSDGIQPIGSVTFTADLGDSYSIDYLRVFNYNETAFESRSVSNAVLSVSDDGLTFTPLGTLTIPKGFGWPDNDPADTGTLFTFATEFGGPVVGRYFKFEVQSNWGDPNFVGLSELQFDSIPEPSTLALLALAACTMLRRRQ